MNRREALRTAAFVGLGLAALGMAPGRAFFDAPTVSAGSARLVCGATGGRVLESLDGGASWQCVARLGETCAVGEIVEDHSEWRATVEARGHRFNLWSTDARTWRTEAIAGGSL